MSPEERSRIISNDYADFIITNQDRLANLNLNFGGDYTTNVINNTLWVSHIPVSNMTYNSFYKFGYAAIPKCFGLLSPTTFRTFSLPALSASRVENIRHIPSFDFKGEGVLIGYVDTGIDYTNAIFRNSNNTTKIVSIWDQTIQSDSNYPKGLYYGTEFTREQINQALNSKNPYKVVPSVDEIGHGTVLAGVTAGSPQPYVGFTGIVPKAEIVMVKLKTAKPYLKNFFQIPQESICYQENDIIFGVKYLLQVAEKLKRPMVICIGLGTNQGAHSEHGILNTYLSGICRLPGIAVVVAGGNEGNRGHHYYKEIASEEANSFELHVGNNEKGFSMELWCMAPNTVAVDIIAPTAENIAYIPTPLTQPDTMVVNYQGTQLFIDTLVKETGTSHQLVMLRFRDPLPGNWRFNVITEGITPTRYHVWLPIESFITPGTFFLEPDEYTTLTTPGNAEFPIVVTAYNYVNETLYYNASVGFTVDGLYKPDLAAPGVNILSPILDNHYARLTGTSLAAAHTAGIVAMILEWGIVKGYNPTMNNYEVRNLLRKGAKRDLDITYPNEHWGFGIIDLYNTYVIIANEYYFR